MTGDGRTVVVQRANSARSMDRRVARSTDEVRVAPTGRVHCTGERGHRAWKLRGSADVSDPAAKTKKLD
ncbi:hypothetical protein V6N11_037833 [Hibiscus sabdariffa]|uniref:Uncharacterized protein n=1 Tax=Hibiscus sabdariffa TaxID=183260 RepID=A0ABR2A2U2_9ROSI